MDSFEKEVDDLRYKSLLQMEKDIETYGRGNEGEGLLAAIRELLYPWRAKREMDRIHS